MRVQFSGIGSGTAWGPIAALLWCGLLGLGIWSFLSAPTLTPLQLVLLGSLLFQGAFHTVFGRETFLYSPHFGPLLVVLAAFGMLSRWRHVSLALACALLATVTINNGTVLREALAFVDASRPPSAPIGATTDAALLHQKACPAPDASVVLADEHGKVAGTVGPGGSLAIGDNGPRVSIWVAYEDAVVLTSDANWSPSTSQRVAWPWTGSPMVDTNNWYYRVTAQAGGNGKWNLDITQDDNLITRLLVLVRGAPGTGAETSSFDLVKDRLVIDKPWAVALTPRPASIQVGDEEAPWRFSRRTDQPGSVASGYALLEARQAQPPLAAHDRGFERPEGPERFAAMIRDSLKARFLAYLEIFGLGRASMVANARSHAASFWTANRLDVSICALVAMASALLVCFLQSRLAFTNTHLDIWFDSDSVFIVDQMTDRFSPHNDTNSRHPIYVLLTYPIVNFQTRILRVDPDTAKLVALVIYSTLCVVAMYVALRLMDKPIGMSLVYTGIFAASTCGLLLGLHERLILGGLTIIAFSVAFLLYERCTIGIGWLTLAASATLGLTITNFMVGGLGLLLARGWRNGIQACVNAVFIVMLLNAIVMVGFPKSTSLLDIRSWPFLTSAFSGHAERLEKAGTLPQKAATFLLHSIAIPEPEIERKPEGSTVRYLSMQKVGILGHRLTWYFAAVLWLVLLGWGVRNLIQGEGDRDLSLLLGLVGIGQFCLFMLYGSEIILFSPYFVPILLMIAAMSWRSGRSNLGAGTVAVLLFVVLLWHNSQAFMHTVEAAKSLI